jgi:hypothetical protein
MEHHCQREDTVFLCLLDYYTWASLAHAQVLLGILRTTWACWFSSYLQVCVGSATLSSWIISALVNYLDKQHSFIHWPPRSYPIQTLEGWIFGDWVVPSPALMTCFCGDTAIMWPPFTVTYWGSGDWLAAPVVGTWGASPGSCLMMTLQ